MMVPSIEREFQTEIPDHQILLSFNADVDADNFYNWWVTKGFYQFEKWVKKASEKAKSEAEPVKYVCRESDLPPMKVSFEGDTP